MNEPIKLVNNLDRFMDKPLVGKKLHKCGLCEELINLRKKYCIVHADELIRVRESQRKIARRRALRQI